jgi:hypothetical protein
MFYNNTGIIDNNLVNLEVKIKKEKTYLEITKKVAD